ncbi:hypothetical protein Ahy_B10g100818 [Arachis hypogaea]|uniref:Uncharacterized protein n=1 Tax=Arachis hypogaea TaxID=3818 RepID=A0A444WXV7_ARAHY|nr:hypothetical protein Ahy_B10g100818 [Arachis hypogaea]
MTCIELQNGLCQSMENSILRRVSSILYRNPVIIFGGLIQFDIMPIVDEESMQNMFQIHRQTQMRQPQIELYVEFENVKAYEIQNNLDIEDDRAAVYEGMNSDSEEDFEATYKAGDEDEDSNVGVEAAAENVVVHPAVSQPMNVPPFMRNLDLDAMNTPEFPEYANIAIRSYTISRGVDYNVYEFEPLTFYAKCKTYGSGCNWLIRASLIRKKGCWEIRRYNGSHTCTMEMISQDHFKTVEEYNINYKRLEERGEAYVWWCDAIGLRHWVLTFDEGHRWGHITTNLVECINSVLKGARNLPVLVLVRATYYQLNELFTQKSAETHERKRAGFT